MNHKPADIRRRIKRNRKPGESRRGQATRLGLPESTIRDAERLGRIPQGTAGRVLCAALGL